VVGVLRVEADGRLVATTTAVLGRQDPGPRRVDPETEHVLERLAAIGRLPAAV
jgi:hypothetical protein